MLLYWFFLFISGQRKTKVREGTQRNRIETSVLVWFVYFQIWNFSVFFFVCVWDFVLTDGTVKGVLINATTVTVTVSIGIIGQWDTVSTIKFYYLPTFERRQHAKERQKAQLDWIL